MADYLLPINRYQFAQFYRFGYTYIPTSTLLKFDGNISDNTKKDLVDHFLNISPFEYNEEYLILHLSKSDETVTENTLFDILDIKAIYPLSKQAKVSIQEKIDQRIKLEDPLFESVLPIIESNIQKKEIEKAIDALWQICGIDGNKEDLLSLIGLENIFNGLSFRQQGTKASAITDGNYWSILIAYDRFEYFPNEIIGYFYDAGQIFAHSKNRPTFEGSDLYKFLSSLNKNLKMLQILSAIEDAEITQSYRTQTTTGDIKKYIIAPLFLMLKDEIRNADDLNSTKLMKHTNELKKYGIQFSVAVVLLGAFFGFKKFYDLYYDKLNLRFFKSFKAEHAQISSQETSVSTIEDSEQKMPELIEVEKPKDQKPEEQELHDNQTEVNNSKLNNQNAEIEASEKSVEEVKTEVVKKAKVAKVKAVINDKNDIDLKPIIIDIIQSKGEMTITNLKKEIDVTTKQKIDKAFIETIINDIPEVELFKEKNTYKVKLKSAGLF